jgi:hypothetical protein
MDTSFRCRDMREMEGDERRRERRNWSRLAPFLKF